MLYFLTAILAVVLVRGIVVDGDAATTAKNILTHESSFRSGFAIGLIGFEEVERLIKLRESL